MRGAGGEDAIDGRNLDLDPFGVSFYDRGALVRGDAGAGEFDRLNGPSPKTRDPNVTLVVDSAMKTSSPSLHTIHRPG